MAYRPYGTLIRLVLGLWLRRSHLSTFMICSFVYLMFILTGLGIWRCYIPSFPTILLIIYELFTLILVLQLKIVTSGSGISTVSTLPVLDTNGYFLNRIWCNNLTLLNRGIGFGVFLGQRRLSYWFGWPATRLSWLLHYSPIRGMMLMNSPACQRCGHSEDSVMHCLGDCPEVSLFG